MKRDVLFLCVHNSARSQIAEAFLNRLCPNDFAADSAGLEPNEINPLAVAVMREAGIDISSNTAKSVFERAPASVRLTLPPITVGSSSSIVAKEQAVR